MSESDPAITAAQLNDLRARVLAQEEVTPAEYRQLIDNIRAARISASRPSAKKRSTTTVTNLDLPDLI